MTRKVIQSLLVCDRCQNSQVLDSELRNHEDLVWTSHDWYGLSTVKEREEQNLEKKFALLRSFFQGVQIEFPVFFEKEWESLWIRIGSFHLCPQCAETFRFNVLCTMFNFPEQRSYWVIGDFIKHRGETA